MPDVQVIATEDGPYRVSGEITLIDGATGEQVPGGDAATLLCRCGGSTTRPCCDGTHSAIRPRGAPAAVQARHAGA